MIKTFLKFALLGAVSLLSACSTDDYFYNDDPGMYPNSSSHAKPSANSPKAANEPTSAVSEKAAQTSGEVTKRVEPGISTVTPSKTTSTTNTNQGPAVPNMAPSAVQ